MEIELFLGSKRRKNLRNSVGNFLAIFQRQKAFPNGVSFSGGSKSGGHGSGAAHILRRSEGEYVSDAAFRKRRKVNRPAGPNSAAVRGGFTLILALSLSLSH